MIWFIVHDVALTGTVKVSLFVYLFFCEKSKGKLKALLYDIDGCYSFMLINFIKFIHLYITSRLYVCNVKIDVEVKHELFCFAV